LHYKSKTSIQQLGEKIPTEIVTHHISTFKSKFGIADLAD